MATAGAVDGLVGRCAEMEALRQRIGRVASSELRVHVCGETGTGKECVARALHDLSPRARRRFVPVNVAGFSDELFVSELFGHARGAFTGATASREGYVAEAEGGTLFVDEVAEMSPLAQVRLLRFLQEREYQRLGETCPRRADVRVISATNVDLARLVQERRFRQDLYFRLVEERLLVPPLRERGDDVLLLARHFLRAFCQPLGRPQPVLGPQAEALLRRYPWPGNVRELESQMRRLVVLAPGREVRGGDLGPEIAGAETTASPAGGLHAAMRCIESEILRRTLERHGGVQARAAAELGITRQALCAKLRRLRGLVGAA
ncbi:MAG TPA: sigma-54 dependent transcriptional regulator [Vicinamibacteria bacterium]|nr:sigma-54 dependent transcriptional regulator [Vicinamibacteria bacterium]